MSNRGNNPRGGSTDTRGRGRGRGGGGGPGRGSSPAPSTTSGHSGFTGGGQRGRGGGGDGRGGPGSGFRGGNRGGGFGGSQTYGGGSSGPDIFQENVPVQLPPRLAPAALDQVITGFKSLKVKPERPLRPGFGTLGNPITLRANFFAVRLPKGPVFDYVVEIAPTTDINRIKGRIFQLLEMSNELQPHVPYIAHDRSQRLVSSRKLPQPNDNALVVPIRFYDADEKGPGPKSVMYNVSIKFERELDPGQMTKYMEGNPQYIDYDPLPLVSALNLVLQHHANRTGVRVGKSRYFHPQIAEKHPLGMGLTAVQGFYASVRPSLNQLLVNVNVCMTAFVNPGNLADRLNEFNQNSRGAMPTLPKAMVKSIRVKTLHLGYKKKLFAIGTTSARNTFFDCEELGGKTSVEQYFVKKYKTQLKYPAELPVVNVGNLKKPNWIPAELCLIEGDVPYRAKLDDKETAAMIKVACNKPRINAEHIVNRGFPSLGLSPAQPPLSGFDIGVDTKMVDIPGRELLPPKLSYGVGVPRVANGSWNILDVKFHRAAQIANWWVLVVQDKPRTTFENGPKDPRLPALIQGFANKLRKCGIALPGSMPNLLPPAQLLPPHRDPERKQSLEIIRSLLRTQLATAKGVKPSFILVLLENRDNYIYPGIKRIGDVEMGLQTIHMQLGKALGDERKQDQYFSNVALKVNTKLGGMNHFLDANHMKWLTDKKTMMIGIDVTHPGPGSREGTPSIAAVVASIDDKFVQFPASLSIQETKKEMLDELDKMLVERLLVYEKKNKVLPERIILYRDGVSEGQFDTVLEEELPQITKAFKKMNTPTRKDYKPKLSIIICGKRHHAKFFPTNSQHADKNGNTRPGTVVDKGVTGVFDFDFYLQAHAGLQGHVKATHYTVVYDENNLTADAIQKGTHDTSYLYARATKAVSLIPAAYYADLACERGRCYLNDFLVDSTTVVGGSRTSSRLEKEEEKKRVFEAAKKHWGDGLHPDMRGSMFYI
ncbi:argonaute-like protein [Crepidotus variabilis]|uniref:Argonaute-like protein n=1 Tax=Crepidotus variabilis TaxID=179855 RepID=A0A9P6EJJ9_9AGAR|nr:argonaute-like protein [Crepidotus variabilis]